MYSRGYYPEAKEKFNIPEGYDGTALLSREDAPEIKDDGKSIRELPPEHPKREIKISPPQIVPEPESEESIPTFKENEQKRSTFGLHSIFDGLPIGRLKGLFIHGKGEKFPFSFDFEDLLIIGIALFLIFSKGGDKELGFMLAALVFIK